MDPNFVFPAIFKNQTGASYNPPSGSLGLFASGGRFYLLTPSGQISGLIDASQTGAFGGGGSSGAADTGYLTGYVSKTETGAFYPASNPSGFITGVDLSAYVTGDVVRPSETGNFITTSQTGQFVGDSETGAFLTTGAADARYVNLTGNQTVSGTKTFHNSIVLPSGAIVTGSGSISFDTSAAFTSAAAGEINWNSDEQTFNLGLNGEVTLQVGLEQLVKVKAGADIRNGMTVYAAGQVGASANIEVLPFIASADGPNEIYFLGIATQEILNGNEGFATTFGKVRNVNGSTYSAGGVRDDVDGSWSVGNILYASPHISGTFTTGAPVSPEKTMEIAMVLAAPNESNITLFVRAEHGYRLSDLHDVNIESLQDSNILKWNAASGRWENSNSINLSGISVSGNSVVTGSVVRPSETGSFITTSQTGQFVGDGETGAFLTTGAADNRYALQSATGNFITSSQTGAFAAAANTGAFLTTGAADARYYGLADGQSISGYAITGYNDAVTGMSVTGDTTKTITLFQRDGTTVTANFADNAGSGSSDTGYLTGYVSKSETGNIAVGAISLSLNGGGSTITTGYKSFTTVTFSGEILEYTILADRTGSIVIDVWKDSYGNFPLTTGDSICVSSKPTLATGIKNTDSTLTSWTKTFSAGDVFGFNVDSVSGVTNVNLTLKVKKA